MTRSPRHGQAAGLDFDPTSVISNAPQRGPPGVLGLSSSMDGTFALLIGRLRANTSAWTKIRDREGLSERRCIDLIFGADVSVTRRSQQLQGAMAKTRSNLPILETRDSNPEISNSPPNFVTFGDPVNGTRSRPISGDRDRAARHQPRRQNRRVACDKLCAGFVPHAATT